MRITCICGKQLKVRDELVGKLVKCPGCGNKLRVAEEETETPPARKEEKAPQRKKAKRKPAARRSALPWVLGGGAAVVVAVVAIVLVFVFTRSRNRSESGQPIVNAQNPPGKMALAVTVVKVKPDKEGVTWKSADLLNYLQGQGITLFPFGVPHDVEHDAKASEHLIEHMMLTDDESASARAPKRPLPVDEALKEQKKGTGLVGLILYRSAEFASKQSVTGDDSNVIWGRFIITVFNPQRKEWGIESGNLRSRTLIQQIRKALGLPVVSVEWPTGPARVQVSPPPPTRTASTISWTEMPHEKGKYSILFPGQVTGIDPLIEGAPVTSTATLPGGEEFSASFTVERRPNPLQDKELMPKLFDAFFQGLGQVQKADFSKRTSLALGDYPGQECLSVIPSKKQRIRCRLYFTEDRTYDLRVTWPSELHPADWPHAKTFLDAFKLIK